MAMRKNTLALGSVLVINGFGRGKVIGYYESERKVYYWIYLTLFESEHLFSHEEVIPSRFNPYVR